MPDSPPRIGLFDPLPWGHPTPCPRLTWEEFDMTPTDDGTLAQAAQARAIHQAERAVIDRAMAYVEASMTGTLVELSAARSLLINAASILRRARHAAVTGEGT